MRARVVLSSQACTPSQAAKATGPCSSWRCAPISAMAAPAADHRHDPLVVVVERRGPLAVDVGEDAGRHRLARLQGDRSELRVRVAVGSASTCGHVADGVDAREALDAEVLARRDAAAATGLEQRPCPRARAPSGPPAQTTQWDRISAPSANTTRSASTSVTDCAEQELDALLVEHLGGVLVGLVGEGRQHDVAVVDEVIVARARRARSWYRCGITSWIMSARAPAVSTPVAPPPTMTKFSAPCSMPRRVEVGVLEQAQDAVAERSRRRRRSRAGTSARRRRGPRRSSARVPMAQHEVVCR